MTFAGSSTGANVALGAAAGDLTGNYPNPTLAATGPGATGPIGSGSVTPVITIDAKGRVTALTSAAIASKVIFCGVTIPVANTLCYHTIFGGPSANAAESAREIIAPSALTLTAFYIRNVGGVGAISLVYTFTVRINGVNTALQVTMPANSTQNTLRSITGQSVSVAAGDRISLQIDCTGGTDAVTSYGWGVLGS